MIKIAVGGQMDKQAILDAIEKYGDGKFSCEIMSDINAALAIKNSSAEYYIGACATGAGGALGMAQGLLGGALCISISMPGNRLSDDKIEAAILSGKKAFGMVNQDIDVLVPTLLKYILISKEK